MTLKVNNFAIQDNPQLFIALIQILAKKMEANVQ
jgi:hypothetical protein